MMAGLRAWPTKWRRVRGGAATLVQLASVMSVGMTVCATVRAEGLGPVGGALGETKPIIDARLRFENVEQDPLADAADAATLRARLGFETGKAWETTLLAEGEFLWPLQSDYRPDNTLPQNAAFPVVADPESYELNRLQLTNTRIPGTTLTFGRQRINLDDHRFIGNVGWRQNEQTYDALRVINRTVPNVTLDVAHVSQVNRFFDSESPQGRYEGDSYLANATYQLPLGKLTGFAYLLDFDPITAVPTPLNPVRVSTETYGVRFAGEQRLSKVKLAYLASYASQNDYQYNPFDFSLDYFLLELTGSFRNFSMGAGQEVLQGDGGVGFATPLATLHRFQGWADKFLATPVNGIDDRYASVAYLIKGLGILDTLAATAVYHRYDTERGGVNLGAELNAQLQVKWRRFLGTVKYADYDAEEGETPVAYRDTAKYWVQVGYVW